MTHSERLQTALGKMTETNRNHLVAKIEAARATCQVVRSTPSGDWEAKGRAQALYFRAMDAARGAVAGDYSIVGAVEEECGSPHPSYRAAMEHGDGQTNLRRTAPFTQKRN